MQTELPWFELGGFGVLAAMFVMVVRWMLTQFTFAIDRNTRSIEVTSMRQVAELRRVSVTLLTMQRLMLAHDLTQSQIQGAEPKERLELVLAKYRELEHAIEEQASAMLRADTAA